MLADHLAKDMQTIHYNKDLGGWVDNFGRTKKWSRCFKRTTKNIKDV